MSNDASRLKKIHDMEQGGEFIVENFVPLLRKIFVKFVEEGFDEEMALYLTRVWMCNSMGSNTGADE